MAVTDAAGNVVERYDYDDYGTPTFFLPDGTAATDASGNPLRASAIANPYLFTGRRYDPESGWYNYRTRYLDPKSGKFTTRDVIGIWGDPWEFGNGYSFVANNMFSWLDPFGLGIFRQPDETVVDSGEDEEPSDGPKFEPPGDCRNGSSKAGSKGVVKGRGDDPFYVKTKKELEDALKEANKNKDRKLAERIKRIMKHKGFRRSGQRKVKKNLVKKLLKKGAKSTVGKVVPLVGAGFFVYDWYQGGFGHAVDELTWPASEIWNDE